MDITQLILDDHHEQRRRFGMLEQLDPGDTAALGAVWSRLAVFLEVHAAAEEQIFYPELLAAGLAGGASGTQTAEEETLDAIHDHNDIRDAVLAVAGHDVGSAGWYAAVAAANAANSDHMAEEEREGLTYFRRHASLGLRHDLAVAFATFEARNFAGVPVVDKDPQAYVRDTEEQVGGGGLPDGSLRIGSLRGTQQV
ncbi:MAG TPA: hemerythrin domain-containing protein [Streptosporangiaceae bacterium]|nr:hemerythrin domain-containing protein [Streptosporangiaceae bacterium]